MNNRFMLFYDLMIRWEESTGAYSIHTQWENHQLFERLCGFEDAVTFACLFLRKDIHRSLSILRKLVPEDKHPPRLPEYYAGRVPIIREVYIFWAIKEGYLISKYDPDCYWLEDKYGNEML